MAEKSGELKSFNNAPLPLKYFIALVPLTIWALTTGYYKVFSVFSTYDDEGYLMMTVKKYLDGGVLYNEVYTQYGPAYYLYKWILNGALAVPVTHDATRLTTLVLWVLTAAGCSLFTYRLTRSTLASAAAYALSFLILTRIVYEAGHPQEWCGVLTVAALLLLTGKPRAHGFDWRVALFGAVIAILFLTKINLGIFLGLAAAITFLSLSAANRLQKILLIAVSAAAVVLPFVLLKKFLLNGWGNLAAAVAVALVSALLIFTKEKRDPVFLIRHFVIAGLSFVLTAGVIVFVVLAQGTTLPALLNGVFFQNLSFGEKFFTPPTIPSWSGWWTILALIAASLCIFFRSRIRLLSRLNAAFIKGAFGFGVVLLPFALYVWMPDSAWLLGLATPFLWIFLIDAPTPEAAGSKETVLPRFFLVPAAALQTLQIFPIAGTQIAFGSLLITVIGILCLHDAWHELKIRRSPNFRRPLWQTAIPAAAALLLIGICAARTVAVQRTFQKQIPVDFYGANRLRLPAEDAAVYTFLVNNIEADCDQLFSMPGIFSLNLWTRKETPNGFNATAWMQLFDENQQQAVIEDLKKSSRPCVVYYAPLAQGGVRQPRVRDFPLARYILDNFKIEASDGEYHLMTRRAAPENF